MHTYKYPRPAVTADAIVFCCTKEAVKVLLIERKNEPFKGCWAFPGGFINMDETAEEAVKRELEEETGLRLSSFKQIGAYSKVDRDPRGRVITIAFFAVVDKELAVDGCDDAAKAKWFDINRLPPLAFDHKHILREATTNAKFLLNRFQK